MGQQRLIVKDKWRRDRYIILYQLQRKLMLFKNLFGRPALRTIELHHHAAAIFVLKLINPILIAIKRGKTRIHPNALFEQGINNSVRVESLECESLVVHPDIRLTIRMIQDIISWRVDRLCLQPFTL